jgi:hypothetical protein
MPKINYREKWEESEKKIQELQTQLDQLKFRIQAVKQLLKEE